MSPTLRRLLAPLAVGALLSSLAIGIPAAAASAAPATGPIALNEVEIAADWVELVNTGSASVDISGYRILDNDDTHVPFTVPSGTTLAAGGHFTADVNMGANKFGLGKQDSARLFSADGAVLLDSYSWTQDPGTSWQRCAEGTGDFSVSGSTSKNATNICAVDAADAVLINEIESNGGTPGDWVELVNTARVAVDVSGLQLKDSDDSHVYTIPAGTSIAAGAYLVLDQATFGFGLGEPDSVRLFAADGTTLIDSYSWTGHAATTYGRCADGRGDFAVTASATKGAPNDCAAPAAAGSVVINEVESNGDDTDWVELFNVSSAAVDISGFRFRDNDDARAPWVAPAGSIIPSKSFFVIDGVSAANPSGFTFGLGKADSARLFAADGVTSVASYSWTDHAAVTYGRCPDGTGDMTTTTVSTKGAPNNCSTPLVINEVESEGGNPGDWVELKNVGTATVDASGLILRDNDDAHTFRIPAGTTVAAGAYLVLDRGDGTTGFDFGLGAPDSLRLFEKDGVTLIDQYAWSAHAATSYGRCPDGVGELIATTAVTRGAVNECAGILNPVPWPGAQTVTTLDDADTFGGDLSGLDWEPSGTGAPGTLWAVQNGDGLLYRIESDGAGGWAPSTADGWSAGKKLGYPNGEAGIVDAEGVTVAGDDSAGGVYVSTERNNAASGVSRPSVLRFDVSGSATSLQATREWNLAADFPGLGANAGLEGITWIPDSALVSGGFVDATTGAVYDPSRYSAHTGGLFFVGVEGTASVYAYALMDDGSFARIATIDVKSDVDFALVADVQYDADRGSLWVVCDEACGGRIAEYRLGDSGSFTPSALYSRPGETADYANEGFAVADDSQCRGGSKPTFYADDNDTDGFSLRMGSIDCTDPIVDPGTGGDGADGAGNGGAVPLPMPAKAAGKDTALLASTGADIAPFIGIGAVLLLAGAAAVVVARRRRA